MKKLLALIITAATIFAAEPVILDTSSSTNALNSFGHVTVETKLEGRVETQWLPLKSIGTNEVRSVGFTTTNLYALIIFEGKTNQILLKQIGQEEFPTHHGTNQVRGGAQRNPALRR